METEQRCASRATSSPSAIFTYARQLRATYAPHVAIDISSLDVPIELLEGETVEFA